MDGSDDRIDAYPALATWVRTAEETWKAHSSGAMTLTEQIDYMSKLTQQVPVPPIRVVYAKAGMHVSAALVTDQRALIDHKLYWAAVSSESEGNYLVGILNTPTLTELVRPLMSYGKDERDIDKAVWKLPIPAYDNTNPLHTEIAQVAKALTADLAERQWRSDYFVTIRQDVRAWLLTNDNGRKLDNLVRELLGEPPLDDAERDAPAIAPVATGLLRLTSGSLGIEPSDIEIDLDIEFDEARQVYLWGYLVSRSGSDDPTYHSVGSPEADLYPEALALQLGDELGALLEEANATGQTVRLYHYGQVEPMYLSRLLDSDADELQRISTDLLDVVRSNYFSGLGYSLKRLAGLTGFRWPQDGMTGADTYPLIAKARGGDGEAWESLLQYNEADTRATKALRTYLRQG